MGQIQSLNHSSTGMSSAIPRRATIGVWVWQLIRPGMASCPRPSMRWTAGRPATARAEVTDSMSRPRTTTAAS